MSVKLTRKQLIDGLRHRSELVWDGGDFEEGDCSLMGEAAEELERLERQLLETQEIAIERGNRLIEANAKVIELQSVGYPKDGQK